MTKEEKQLLLKDLCARLPYGITIYRITDNSIHRFQYSNIAENIDQFSHFLEYSGIDNIKPYLRPMESITEEEITEIYEFARPYIIEEIKHGAESDNPDRKVEIENGFLSNAVIIDELNKRHIDYRGLIPMGLALEAPDGMYLAERKEK